MSCTAIWLKRVARFIFKKRVLLLSKALGLEMGTRFFFYVFTCAFKLNNPFYSEQCNYAYNIHPQYIVSFPRIIKLTLTFRSKL